MASDYVSILGQSTTLDTGSGSGSKPRHEPIKATSGALHVANTAVEPGQAAGEVYDRLATAQIAEPYDVTATGAIIAGPCIYYGMETIVTGTSSTLTLHNNASAASGTVVMPAVATGTVNVLGYQRAAIGNGGVGALCSNGLYATVGGTGSPTFRVWAVPVAP